MLECRSHTKRLSNLVARREKAKVDKGGQSNTWNRVPRKLFDELKRQEEKVYPDGPGQRTQVRGCPSSHNMTAYCLGKGTG